MSSACQLARRTAAQRSATLQLLWVRPSQSQGKALSDAGKKSNRPPFPHGGSVASGCRQEGKQGVGVLLLRSALCSGFSVPGPGLPSRAPCDGDSACVQLGLSPHPPLPTLAPFPQLAQAEVGPPSLLGAVGGMRGHPGSNSKCDIFLSPNPASHPLLLSPQVQSFI